VSRIEISLPDQTYAEITRLVEQGEFLDEDKAFEELISMGVSAYDTTEEEPGEVDDELPTPRWRTIRTTSGCSDTD